ncbi:MAG: arginase [Cytophagales bacterium]
MNKIDYVLSIPSDIGAQKFGTSLAMEALIVADIERNAHIFKPYPFENLKTKSKLRGSFGKFEYGKYINDIIEINKSTAQSVETILSNNYTPLVVSGDHSNAIGIMAGIREFLDKGKKLGVIWIDAHADIHTPYTTPSGNFHGMSLATNLGFDNIELGRNDVSEEFLPLWNQLKHCGKSEISPKINPEDVFFIGLRDFEIQEYQLIRDYKLKHSSPYDIKAKGISQIAETVVEYFTDYDAVYVSFDVDVLDTTVSTGTGTPVYNGLMLEEAKSLITTLKKLQNIVLWEFTEINPLLDNQNSMAKATLKLIDVLMKD